MEVTTNMKVNVVSRKMIKPCTPTPSHLRTHNISLIDEINPSMNVFRILYYQSHDVKYIARLEESLAQVLPLFYPLAGRYFKERRIVDCNDEGALFLTAQVNCQLSQFISAVDVQTDHLNHLLPIGIGEADEPEDPMFAVKFSRFQCGGLAMGLCVSHKVFDACSLGTLLKAWTNATTGGELVIRPIFDSYLYFPSENLEPIQYGVTRTGQTSVITKRIVFDKNAISRLRQRVASEWKDERPPSRAVVVSAVLTQALLRADWAKLGKTRASLIGKAINVRGRTIPPISQYACGPWYSMSYIESCANESNILQHDYPSMVMKMHEVTMQGIRECEKILSDKEFGRWAMVYSEVEAEKRAHSLDVKGISFTDWTKFGDYEVDFGFGRPIWVSMAAGPIEDFFVLMNTKDNDGIEAWVYLHESDMRYFERDEDLRMLTTRGPRPKTSNLVEKGRFSKL